jgi:hypothetical protein
MRTRAGIFPNLNRKIKQTRTRTQHIFFLNPMKFCKKEIEQGYDIKKKTYPKLVLNKLKLMGNSTFKYTYWAPSSRKFFNKLPTYMWPIVPMCEL